MAVVAWLAVLAAVSVGDDLAPQRAPADAGRVAAAPNAHAEAERLAVWNSPEMRYALNWLEEYFRTSRQSPPEVEQAYLRRLERLPAAELREWLEQLALTHRQVAQQNQSFAQARRDQVAEAAARRAPPPTPTVRRVAPQNYVQPLPPQQVSVPPYLDRYAPLRSFEILHYLDTWQISEDLRALREASGR